MTRLLALAALASATTIEPFPAPLAYLLEGNFSLANAPPRECGCHWMKQYGLGSAIHTFGRGMWEGLHRRGTGCVDMAGSWIWDRSARIFPGVKRLSACPRGTEVFWNHDEDARAYWEGQGLSIVTQRAAATQLFMSKMARDVYAAAEATDVYRALRPGVPRVGVHVRWGDKSQEMKLVPMGVYVDAARELLGDEAAGPVDVVFMSEDYAAVQAFRALAPANWAVLVHEPAILPSSRDFTFDVNDPNAVRGHEGRPSMVHHGFHNDLGRESLVALVLSMQAKKLVVTGGSNWGRLMVELCLDKGGVSRCDVVDVNHGKCSSCTDGNWD